jgi:hypothetical protein
MNDAAGARENLNLEFAGLVGASETEQLNYLAKSVRQGHEDGQLDEFFVGEILLPAREIIVGEILVAFGEDRRHFHSSAFAWSENGIEDIRDRPDFGGVFVGLLNLSRSDVCSIMAASKLCHANSYDFLQRVVDAATVEGTVPRIVESSQ